MNKYWIKIKTKKIDKDKVFSTIKDIYDFYWIDYKKDLTNGSLLI